MKGYQPVLGTFCYAPQLLDRDQLRKWPMQCLQRFTVSSFLKMDKNSASNKVEMQLDGELRWFYHLQPLPFIWIYRIMALWLASRLQHQPGSAWCSHGVPSRQPRHQSGSHLKAKSDSLETEMTFATLCTELNSKNINKKQIWISQNSLPSYVCPVEKNSFSKEFRGKRLLWI